MKFPVRFGGGLSRNDKMTACAAALLALICGAAVARDLNNQNHGRGGNCGQRRKHYR
jgi:hypothetical protein